MAKERKRREKEPEAKAERVEVFGEDWTQRRQHNDGLFGIVLIGAGILLLLNTIGVLSWRVWDHIWRFWPVLIILIGLKILVGGSSLLRAVVALLGFLFIALVVLFAINQTNPDLLHGLPPVFYEMFNAMKGTGK